MSHPNQFGPPNQPSGGGGSTLLWVLLIIGLVILLVCGGLCAGCVILARQAGTAIGEGFEEALTIGVLYAQAQQAVTTDERVTDRLGQPLSPQMYQRQSTGPLQSTETFQFDVTGPQGTAIVSAVGVKENDSWRLSKITVTFEDGSVIDVEPPDESDFNFGTPPDVEMQDSAPDSGDQPDFGTPPEPTETDATAPNP